MSEQVVSDRVDRGEHAGRVWLGGDTKSRSIFRVDRMERPEWVLLGVFGVVTFVVLLTGHSIVSLVVAMGIAAVGWGLTVRVSVPGTSLDSSVALWVRTRVSWVVRGWARRRSSADDDSSPRPREPRSALASLGSSLRWRDRR